MSDYSLITCVSDVDIYDRCLLQSANAVRRGHDIEFIPIINNDNLYSASNALNIGINSARSDILIFVHQDVRLLDDWFQILQDLLGQLPDMWGILGCAGIALRYTRADLGMWGGAVRTHSLAVGSVWDSDEAVGQSPYWDGSKELTTIHAADECLLVLNRQTGLRFDSLFGGFHFYGVDMCLQARAAGYSVHGAHLPIVHYGRYSASMSGNTRYWPYLRMLHNKWKLRFPEMLGTHMHWAAQELTSYIPVGLEADDGTTIHMRAAGLSRVRISSDAQQEIL